MIVCDMCKREVMKFIKYGIDAWKANPGCPEFRLMFHICPSCERPMKKMFREIKMSILKTIKGESK